MEVFAIVLYICDDVFHVFCSFFTILNCPLLDPYPVKPFYNKSLAVTDSIQWHARSVSACKLGVGVYCFHFLRLSVFPPVYLSLTLIFFISTKVRGIYYRILYYGYTYSKTCPKWPLKNRQNKGLNDKK